MSKNLPKIESDRHAKDFLKKDLSEFLTKGNFKASTFEFAPKDKSITLRVSNALLEAVQATAKAKKTNYQKIIREAIEEYLKKAS